MRMKKITATTALVLFSCFTASYYSVKAQEKIEGEWVGGFDAIKKWLTADIHFRMDGAGLKATLDIPNLGGVGIALDHVRVEGSRVHFELPDDTGNFIFDGQIKDGVMEGLVEHRGKRNPFHLVRIAEIDPKILEDYIGIYQIERKKFISIASAQDKLGKRAMSYVDFETGDSSAILPSSETIFFTGAAWPATSPVESRISFTRNARGEVIGFIWHHKGQRDRVARKIKSYTEEEVSYQNADITLAGSLITPAGPGPHPAIILVHGSAATTREAWRHYANFFARSGIAVLIYDKRGAGKSVGGAKRGSLEDLSTDVLAGIDFLKSRREINPKQIGLWGLSQGCWVIELAAARSKDVAFMIAVSGGGVSGEYQETRRIQMELRANGFSEEEIRQANDFMKQKFHVARTGEGWEKMKILTKQAHGEDWFGVYTGNPSSVEDLRRAWDAFWNNDPSQLLKKINCPVLAIFGELDTSTPVPESVVAIEKAMKTGGNKDYTIKVFPRANHYIQEAQNGGTREFVKRYVPEHFYTMTNWLLKRVTIQTYKPRR